MGFKRRWYDINPELGEAINKLEKIEKITRDPMIAGIKDIIIEYDPNLIFKNLLDFPLTLRQRWYDQDPYNWITINAIKYVDKELMKKIIEYLKNKLEI